MRHLPAQDFDLLPNPVVDLTTQLLDSFILQGLHKPGNHLLPHVLGRSPLPGSAHQPSAYSILHYLQVLLDSFLLHTLSGIRPTDRHLCYRCAPATWIHGCRARSSSSSVWATPRPISIGRRGCRLTSGAHPGETYRYWRAPWHHAVVYV